MAITRGVLIDKIVTMVELGKVNVRIASFFKEDGVEIPNTRSFHHRIFYPDSDIKDEDPLVKEICSVCHTEAVKAAWESKKAGLR